MSQDSPLSPLRNLFIKALEKDIPLLAPEEKIVDALKHCLLNGGKRIRPIIVLAIAKHLGNIENVMPAALSVEYFHTASLIADDLPCMDDETYRRDKKTLHAVFGESTALLTSYGLITAAFAKIHENSTPSHDGLKRFEVAMKLATQCAGFHGATTGQYWDLFPSEENTIGFTSKVIYHKSITLFEVAFAFGWIFGGGDLERLSDVKQAAYHYGYAFQIADDLMDAEEDLAKDKTVNMVSTVGYEATEKLLKEHIDQYMALLEALKINSQELNYIADKLIALALL